MTAFDSARWEPFFAAFLARQPGGDAAHDPAHIRRVVANAKRLAAAEGADLHVVLPAAWLHDCVHVPKSSPDRKRASVLAAAHAVAFLRESGYDETLLEAIGHAIEAHSFSAQIEPKTLEAGVVQDADRLDALGAIGLARTLALGGEMKRELYAATDPFCDHRAPDDGVYSIDHLPAKLLRLRATMRTQAGRDEAARREVFLHEFLAQLRREI